MPPPPALVGIDVLRGTVLACSADRSKPVLWAVTQKEAL